MRVPRIRRTAKEDCMTDHDPTTTEIVALLAQVYTPEGVRVWLDGRNKSLGGERPMDLMATLEGRRRVYERAWQLAEGAFA
jgi:Protein of unknown function (DUF2384)